jgi:putative ABC transport system permease protein
MGIGMAILFLSPVNETFDKSLSAAPLLQLPFLAGAVVAVLLLTLLSGMYPSFVLSGFNPIASLKNQIAMPGKTSVILRKALVVFQFMTSIGLIIFTVIIARQMQYFQKKELGFNKEFAVEVSLPESDSTKRSNFKSLLQNQLGIQGLSFCLGVPISDNGIGVSLKAPQLPASREYNVKAIPCYIAYQNTYGIQLLAGRWILPLEEKAMGTAVVVNHQLAKTLGFSNLAEAIGQAIELGLNNMRHTIVGVTADFHTASFQEDIPSVALTPFPYFYYDPGEMMQVLSKIAAAWKQVYSNDVYSLKFIDETLDERYKQETLNYNLFKAFSALSIFICCIGLWGLISFVVTRKQKKSVFAKL